MATDPTKPKPPRSETGTATRVRLCFELLLAGFTPTEIARQAAENFRLAAEQKDHEPLMVWGVSDRQVRTYCAQARKEFEQVQALKREQAVGSSLSRREHMYRKAMQLDRVNTALRVQDSIDRMMGLYGDFNPGGAADDRPKGIMLPGGVVVYL